MMTSKATEARVRARVAGTVVAALCLVGATASAQARGGSGVAEKSGRAFRTAERGVGAGEIVRPVCETCALYDVYGNTVEVAAGGGVAVPIDTTYSFTHGVGADVDGDGTVNCTILAESPPPEEPDDIVTFDGVAERIRTHVDGVVPIVNESLIDFGDPSRTIIVESRSPSGTELFPDGLTDSGTGKPLTDACVFLGLFDALDWDGMDTLTSARISFTSNGAPVAGPFDLDPGLFSDPWDGRVIASFADLAGAGVNGLRLELTVEKGIAGPVGACCIDGTCVGDNEERSCVFQDGTWHPDASCGADPELPTPVCLQETCMYSNGGPLDDVGQPVSQFAPDAGTSAAAVDDFTLRGGTGADCQITQVRVWVSHGSGAGQVFPETDYQGVNVTIYADDDPPGPRGEPTADGGHVPDEPGGIVYSQRIPTSAISTRPAIVSCVEEAWQLDIPIEARLNKNRRYWLEVQPILDAALGEVHLFLSRNNNDQPAEEIDPTFGITDWQRIGGNQNACAGTPPDGTRVNLAFELIGEPAALTNDFCADALAVTDGITPFSNVGAGTDGDPEPEVCSFFLYNDIESDVWFEYTATCTGTVTASLCGSDYDTKMAVYGDCGRCPPSNLPVACNEDNGTCLNSPNTSQVQFSANAGACYRLRVGGFFGDQGKGILLISCDEPPPPTGACCSPAGVCLGTLTEAACTDTDGSWFVGESCPAFDCPVAPPPHDTCEACIPLETGVEYIGTNVGAGGTDISSCANSDSNDVWHCWEATCTGPAVISTCTSALTFDTTLAVYDSCGGAPAELVCNDDGCFTQSRIAPDQSGGLLMVEKGQRYYIRVAGYNGAAGEYRIKVDSCAGACCEGAVPSTCRLFDRRTCLSRGGVPMGSGTACLGDGDGDGRDDVCDGCPEGFIESAAPAGGTVDARQPHAPDSVTPAQGIGSDDEPIVVTLDAPLRDSEHCFALCESPGDGGEANQIREVLYLGAEDETRRKEYEILLDRPVTPGSVARISFLGGGEPVEYISHPGNVDGDGLASVDDLIALIDCCIAGVCEPAYGVYSCDVDRSAGAGPADLLRTIDLLNGGDAYDVWMDTALPVNVDCP